METPDPPNDPWGLRTGGNLTPHDIPRILRVDTKKTPDTVHCTVELGL